MIKDSTTVVELDRHARRRIRTRANLLEAAHSVVSEMGYHNATVADITRRADVGVGTFYVHFRDKDELLQTMVNDGIEEVRIQVEAAVLSVPLAQSLPIAVRTICSALHSHRAVFQMALTSNTFVPQIIGAQNVLAAYLTAALEAARAEYQTETTMNMGITARLITGMITQSVLWWLDHDTDQLPIIADNVLNLLRNGLPRPFLEGDSA